MFNRAIKRFVSTRPEIVRPPVSSRSVRKMMDGENHTPLPYTGPSIAEIKKMRSEHLVPSLFLYYREPIMVVEGKGQFVWDEKGRRYLDCFGGIVTISAGHCHPETVKAAKDQLDRINHTTTIYLNEQIAQYAKELVDRFPKDSGLSMVYFVNAGSEANDLAIAMARAYTGNHDIIALRNAYHGMSYGTQGLTALSTWHKTPMAGVHHALCPDRYRGPYGYDDPDAAEKYAWDVKNIIQHTTPGKVAGFICEPIQGVGGTIEMPEGYLKRVYETIREHGGVNICDEVQTGFGRMGTDYWAFEMNGVTPDIVTLAKGIGNGVPLAAVVTRPEIAEAFTKKIHFNTYGGNPVSSAVGRAVLRVIDEENLQENCLKTGEALKKGLVELQHKYPNVIGDVRGKGLMLGVELVKDPESKTPNPELTNEVFEECKNNGVLIGKGGLFGNVFRIKPPMCFNERNVDTLVNVLDDAFKKCI